MTETELIQRLEKLERNNRTLKAVALTALILPATLLLMSEARPSNTVSANKFVLLDREGRTRAVLQVGPVPADSASLTFLDGAGRERVRLVGGTGPMQNAFAALELGEDAGSGRYILTSSSGHGGATLSDGGLVMRSYPPGAKAGSVLITGPGSSGPALEITDSQGFTTDIGVSGIVTPETGTKQETSAASIVMFGNDKKHRVIWRAP